MIITKQNWFKRTLSLLLALVMCMSMVNVTAFAEGTDDGTDAVIWASLYGDKGTNSLAATCDSINDVTYMTDGRYVAAGAFDGNGVSDADGQKGKTDAALLLYDQNGALQKQTLVGGSKADYFYKVTECAYGGFIAVGASQSEDGDLTGLLKGGYDGLVAEFDSEGNLLKAVTVGGNSKDELRDVVGTFDGGYIAVGYTQSTDGDLSNAGKTATDRDALIVKLNKDLNIEWIHTYGIEGTATTGLDDFYSVKICLDGGYIAVGGVGSTDGVASKNKDICIVRYAEDGELLWEKTYGGSGDDYAASVTVSPYATNYTEDSDRNWDVEVTETGFVLTGTAASDDGVFSSSKTESGVSKAFFMKIDPEGNMETLDLLENTVGSTGESVLAVNDGYLMTGIFQSNDLDFTGSAVYGKKDFYAAYYSSLGNFLNMTTFGSDDDETVKGITRGCSDDYVLFGSTKSSSFYENTLAGKYDGFLLCVKRSALETYAEEKYLVPVKAWKETEDEPSMMSPLLYQDAYVEKTGEQYKVTVYFTNAVMMGTQVNASTLGSVSYEQNGEMIAADADEYDILTQVKSSTITIGSLSEPVKFYINGTMGVIRLVFDEESKVSTDTPPYFPPVEVTRPDFDCLWKTNIGGSDVDYANAMTVLQNGNIVTVGQTYSNDGDFAGKLTGFSGAYINTYDSTGKLLETALICGGNVDSTAYAACIDAAGDGGYYLCGGYEEGVYADPSGDFAVLNTEGSVHGQIDGYYAKYDSDGNLLWMKGFSGSAYDQIKQIKATDDGGCILLIESNSEDGDMTGLSAGIFDLVLIKCDQDGNEQWKKVISGSTMQSASFGTAILDDGSYIVGGYAYLGYTFGDFENLTYYGNTFDLFTVKISKDGELIWAKSYGGDGVDYCNTVTPTSDGGFIMTGSTKSTTGTFDGIGTSYENPFVMKCDADGNVQWCDVLKSSEKGETVKAIELSDKYIVLGSSYGTDFDFANINKGSRDVFVAIYDENGTRTFLDTIGGVNLDYAIDIAATGSNTATILMDGSSTDGDLADLNRGESDGTLLAFEVDGLKAVDKSALQALIETAKGIDNLDGKYTELSFDGLCEAVKDAENVYSNAFASRDDVDNQVSALQYAIDSLVEVKDEILDKNNLEDGTYWLYAYMFKPDKTTYSMANNAISHKIGLEVIDGEYYVTMQLKGLSIYNLYGYLADISYYDEGYTYDALGIPTGSRLPVEVLSTQKDSDGNDIIDQYNSADDLYPAVIRFKLPAQAISDENGFVPMNVFVPIMETIAEGNGDQNVLMKLDWATLTKTTEDDPGFQPEDPVEQSPAVDHTDKTSGVTVHADKGVFEEGVQVIVTEITKGADYDNTAIFLSDIGKKFKLYGVKFLDKDGNEVAPNGTVTIGFPIAAGYDSSNLAVYRINKDGSKTLVKGTVEDGFYKIITKTAAQYALIETDSTIIDEQNTVNVSSGTNSGVSVSPQTGVNAPQTGDNSNIALWFMLMTLSAGMLGVLFATRKRRTIKGE